MKILTIPTLIAFFGILPSGSTLYGQSCSLEVIGSAGMYVPYSEGSMTWTIGEVCIETYSGSAHFLTQGFHQPDMAPVVVETEFFIPEGFSPNQDVVNDFFFIRGIKLYPNNSIVIFNRWGNKVYEAAPYQNLWDGTNAYGLTVGGDELPIGTYFYVFDFGNGMNKLKGTIYLNR